MNSARHPSPRVVRPRPALFRALGRREPPAVIRIGERSYSLATVLKHDSWAATALYEGEGGKVICKFNREQSILGIPARWLGRWLARREGRALRLLADLPNVPPPMDAVRADGREIRTAVAHPYIEGHPLGRKERVNDAFFPRLEMLVKELHRRGLVYVDLHKRENILVGVNGEPYLIDFQVCFRYPWPAMRRLPLFALFYRILCRMDLYHLRKHFYRHRPELCLLSHADIARGRPWSIRLHRLFAQPLRQLRRKLLVWCGVRSGRGDAITETDPEDAVRREQAQRPAA